VKYDFSKALEKKRLTLGNGTEWIKLLLSKASKDRLE
jgi:hypothetical protein